MRVYQSHSAMACPWAFAITLLCDLAGLMFPSLKKKQGCVENIVFSLF